MFSNLLSSINDGMYVLLDNLVFVDSSIVNNISNILGTSASEGINLLCNSLIYGFLIYYAISYLLSHLTFSQVEKPSQFLFKLLLCAIALNFSELICSSIINLFSNISSFIKDLGHDVFGYTASFNNFVKKIYATDSMSSGNFNLFSFDGLLKGLTSIGFINLTISYAVRYVLIKALIIVCPFAILSLSNSKTSFFFKSWLKTFISILFLQVFVAIILIICFSVFYDDQILFLEILHLGMVYALVKANSFVKELMGGLSTDVSLAISNISSIFNTKG